ncbi:hypothetical protein HanRHA438_Chr09g0394091 [Helianthus annuus]|nr:hypothetical protein HanIR_Chr09g0412261 [Helianthus annuus]KAJ0533780.1 hypothetical protein HanIR_Chr09g0412321 [Helianthus annuus]KAJ0887716.1 hypothetical protein HanRHA438_Chr09g0394051 [Helianthus annuus]KAJ0887720.1 hypothetical protein HanRHA438_Chr09g0394091 [Helianthus annuus]
MGLLLLQLLIPLFASLIIPHIFLATITIFFPFLFPFTLPVQVFILVVFVFLLVTIGFI